MTPGLTGKILTYDKTGYRQLIKDVKAFILDDPDIKMTKARCEVYFVDDGNFNL